VILSAVAVAGCKSRGEEFDMKGSPERIHQEANRDLATATSRRDPEARAARGPLPFSDPARQAQIDLIYAYYKNREAESAIDQATSSSAKTRRTRGWITATTSRGSSTSSRAQTRSNDCSGPTSPSARRRSAQVVPGLPDAGPAVSDEPYAADARQRMVYLRNRLADYEMHVARYYMKPAPTSVR